ncbi:MAG TPA: nucleotidyltransferase family protein [Magnetospirillaceae bacterium]|jgi:D-glycero-alpha-D-manno-heptose 1-phosphate guanylyltransferase
MVSGRNAAAGVTAVVLAGGKGTRIAQLYPDMPKPMIPAAGQPFLHWVTAWLVENGIGDIVYSIGHMAAAIENWAQDERKAWPGVQLRTAAEPAPLGTGGAVRACLDLCGPWILVANGDSLVHADLRPVLERAGAGTLDGAIVGLPMADTSRYGSLDADDQGLLRGFFEKRPGSGLINGGVYLFKRALLERFPTDRSLSMETDIFPALLAQGARLAVATSDRPFLDIGTPQSVTQAEDFVRRVFGAGGSR